MKLELRFVGESYKKFLPEDWKGIHAGIAIGSEGCPNCLPPKELLETTLDDTRRRNIEIRLITPRVPQAHINKVMDWLEFAVECGYKKITINDYGVLYRGTDLWKDKEVEVSLGRSLSWSMEECPWYEDFIRYESEEVAEQTLMSNMENSRKLEFLKKLGVKGIEVEALPGVLKNCTLIRKAGMQISAHYEYSAAAFARACHTASFHEVSPPDCKGLCYEPIEIALEKVFRGRTFFQPSARISQLAGNMRILGNIIYGKNKKDAFENAQQYMDAQDVLVVNCNMYKQDELSELLAELNRQM